MTSPSSSFWSIVLLACAVLLTANVIWAYRDANARGRSGVLVALLVLLAPWPIGVVAWILLRPKLEIEDSAVGEEINSSDTGDDQPDQDIEIKRRANEGLL